MRQESLWLRAPVNFVTSVHVVSACRPTAPRVCMPLRVSGILVMDHHITQRVYPPMQCTMGILSWGYILSTSDATHSSARCDGPPPGSHAILTTTACALPF